MAEKTRILVPVDGTRESEATVVVAARMAEAFGAELILTRVVEVIDAFGPYTRADVARMVEENRAYLRDLVQRWELPVEWTQCLVGQTDNRAKEIVHIAKATEADLIIMAGHGEKGLQRWLKGSVCDEVIHAKVCPVMVVPTTDVHWYERLHTAPAAAVLAGKAPELAKT